MVERGEEKGKAVRIAEGGAMNSSNIAEWYDYAFKLLEYGKNLEGAGEWEGQEVIWWLHCRRDVVS